MRNSFVLTMGFAFAGISMLASGTEAQSVSAPAVVGPMGTPDPADVDAMANILSPYVYVLTRPVYAYNWYAAKSDSDLSPHSTDPKGLADAQSTASQYWAQQGTSHPNDMYGTGLYLSTDPVATHGYSQGSNDWQLTQVQLPTGMRLLDDGRDAGVGVPLDQAELITRLGCPESWKYRPLLDQMLNPGNSVGYPKCQAAIRAILQDKLKIDIFAYNYGATSFKECSADDPDEQSAFVLLNGSKLNAENTHVFNRFTQDDVEDRTRIQSLFYKAALDNNQSYPSSSTPSGSYVSSLPNPTQLTAFLMANGGAKYAPWAANSTGGYSMGPNWSTVICSQQTYSLFPYISGLSGTPSISSPLSIQCVQVTGNASAFASSPASGTLPAPAPPTYPQTLSASAPPPNAPFLWSDLDGKPSDKTLGTWIQKNLFGCAEAPPYIELKDLLSRQTAPSCAPPSNGTEQAKALSRAILPAVKTL